MNDDWRVRVELHEEGFAKGISERLEDSRLEHDLESSFHNRVIVSADGPSLFCYAGTREQAEAAEALIKSVAGQHGWHVETGLQRWHPTAEEWEDPDKPLPRDADELAAEHAELRRDEAADAVAQGYPDYEVRVQCRTHRDCAHLSERLEREGLPNVRRWKYLMVGASDEDAAAALAERIKREAPPGSVVSAEGNMRAIIDEGPPNPFAIFGGLGG
jgi:hypothetical protein